MSSFAGWAEQKGLIDLGFSSLSFTWRHVTNIETSRTTRLDRGMCDILWRQRFLSASVRHQSHYSDHYPMLLQLQTVESSRLGDRPFKF